MAACARHPAVKKEDVKVTLDQGVLTIFGERKRQTDDKTEKFHRVESFYGSFERSFSLPDHVNKPVPRAVPEWCRPFCGCTGGTYTTRGISWSRAR
jgi:hypothetical protein